MKQDDAIALISAAVTDLGGTWADLGAGNGTFTRALAELLGRDGVVYAVDRDVAALRELAQTNARDRGAATVRTIVGDFTEPIELTTLDGAVLANALHYVPYREQVGVLQRIIGLLAEHAPLVIVEYDRRTANRWVPFPISIETFQALAREAGLSEPTVLATRPSRYEGTIYSAVVRRPGAAAS